MDYKGQIKKFLVFLLFEDELEHKFLARLWKVKAQEAWNATKVHLIPSFSFV